MEERVINDIYEFTKKCDEDFLKNEFPQENAIKSKEYIAILKEIRKTNDIPFITQLIKKLEFIKNQINAVNYHKHHKDAILNLVSLSVTDYIINLVKEKHLTDPLLISRFVYMELSKVLYYDVSYVKQESEEAKEIMCNASIDVKKEKIFSYVICTQWIQLCKYILEQFDIDLTIQKIPNQHHVWGEIRLNDEEVIILDATDYINSSIDLSNAKSLSPTVGFVVVPKEYSHLRLHDVFTNKYGYDVANKISDCYKYNRELDLSLGYIDERGYKPEIIIRENELFHYGWDIISDKTDLEKYSKLAQDFFRKLKIPNNMDGYEIYAYYNKFIKHLPKNISSNMSLKTLYVDSFSYNHTKIRKKILQVPEEYLKYLEDLINNKYYKYLSDKDNELLKEIFKDGFDAEHISNSIAECELKIAQINRNLNLCYAINKLHFFKPFTCETSQIQLYEPIMGSKILKTDEEFDEYKKLILVK